MFPAILIIHITYNICDYLYISTSGIVTFKNFIRQVDPSTPQNLYELVKGEMPILSIAWSLASMEEKYKIRSTLTTSIIPTLLADEGISAQKQDVYNRLRNITLFPSEVRFKLFWSLSVGEFFKNFNHTSYEREDTFAVVDHTDTFKLFGQNLGYFGNFKPAIAHSAMHFYTMRSIWIVRKNFFYNVFTHGLTSLVEGGIYERWSKNTRIQRPLLECYAAFLKMKKRDNKLTLIGCSAGCAEATTLKQVTVPFDLYLVMVLGAVGIFMKELKLILKEVLRSGYYSILLKIRTLEPHLRFMMAKVLYL